MYAATRSFWDKYFAEFLSELEFKSSDTDPCLCIRNKNGKKLNVLLNVDNGLVASTDLDESKIFIDDLKSRFRITSRQTDFFPWS